MSGWKSTPSATSRSPGLRRARILHAAVFCAAFLSGPRVAWANVGEAFGFGSRTGALAGAGVAWGFEGFAAYDNPAALPLTGGKRFVLSFAVVDMEYRFKGISNVVIENAYTSDKVTLGDVDTSYRSTFGQELGFAYQIFPDAYHFTFGLTSFLPINQLAYMDTGETFIPEYVLYRARTQRPQFEISFGMEPSPGFFIGAGFHLAFSLTSNATVFLQTDASKPSTMRFGSSLKPKAAPFVGVLYVSNGGGQHPPTSAEAEPEGSYSLGAVIRLPVTSANSMTLKSGARAFGSFAALDFNFTSVSALFYDPLSLEAGGSFQLSSAYRLFLQADYQFWNKFEAPALDIQEPTVENGGVNISGSKVPAFSTQNVLIPRIGLEHKLSDHAVLRGGYAYRKSFLTQLPTGPGNYLDPPKHIITAGLGFKFDHFLNFETPCNLDLSAAYQQLVTQDIAKTPGDERGQGTGDLKIGAPGYQAGGKIFGGGLSLTLAF